MTPLHVYCVAHFAGYFAVYLHTCVSVLCYFQLCVTHLLSNTFKTLHMNGATRLQRYIYIQISLAKLLNMSKKTLEKKTFCGYIVVLSNIY